MEVKGTAVKSVKEFVQKKFGDNYQQWSGGLSVDSKKIFEDMIDVTRWYPLNKALVEPTTSVGRSLYSNDLKKAAWEMGRFSAETALTGIYRVFVLLATPSYIIGRAGKVFATYFKPLEMRVVHKEDKRVEVEIFNCNGISEVIEWRVGGWMEKALEICGTKDLKVDIVKSAARGDAVTHYVMSWN